MQIGIIPMLHKQATEMKSEQNLSDLRLAPIFLNYNNVAVPWCLIPILNYIKKYNNN